MSPEGSVKKRILVVDDDPSINRFLTESLRLRGYEVLNFPAAEPAMDALGKEPFDLALLDILLPGVNGLQFCRRIRQHPGGKELPVIMMTAFYKQAEHIRKAREQYGCTDYLLKPFALKDLHRKIEELIGPPTSTPEAEPLRIDGTLAETSLADILHNLYSLSATGLLQLEKGDVKKVVYIRNGYPIFVRSNLVREFLGQMLLRSEVLSEEELERSLQVSRERKQQHGAVLIEMGLLSPHQLNEALRNQVTEKLMEIFSWGDGTYRFMQAREFKQGVTRIDLSPANLILQGLREYADRTHVRKLLEPHLAKYPRQAENPLYRFQEVQLSAVEQRIFNQCRGKENLEEILKRYQLSRREAEPLLAALLCTGILEAAPEPTGDGEIEVEEESAEIRGQRERFLKAYRWMMQQDYFTLLGVGETEPRDQVRKSYYSMVKKYHPDRFFEENLLPDLKEKVNALFQRISDAHETLTDPVRKSRYINELKGTTPSKDNLETVLQAETAFQKGLVLFRVKKYNEALEAFNLALALGPREADYLMHQAWTHYKCYPGSPTEAVKARQNLLQAIELNPRLANAHLYLGCICKDLGEEKEARRRFERAAQCNPDCTEALRELRLMNMRQGKAENARKGLLGKVFRK